MTFSSSYGGVRTHHPEYDKRIKQWVIARDCFEGSDAIKAKGTDYLPMVCRGEKPDRYDRMVYKNFLKRADYTNFFAQVHDVLHGMIENRPAKIEYPNELKEKGIVDNIDMQGNNLDQFCSDCLSDVLITGFGGILADLPKINGEISEAQAKDMGIRPYLTYYKAESIINWKYKVINGIKRLAMVVLEEEIESGNDDFSHDTKKQWRVLKLDNNNHCIQEVWAEKYDESGKNEGEVRISINPVIAKDNFVDFIPFIMLPFNEPVKPILYDIALLNIGHYQKTADLNAANHKTTLPMAIFTGHTPEVDKETGEPEPVIFGQDMVVQLPEPEAKFGMLEFSGQGIEHNEASIARVESQMFILCSHIIAADKKTAENKSVVSMHRQGEDAKLATIAKIMSKKLTDGFKIICQWEADNSDCLIELNSDFSSLAFDANAVNAIANIFSQGKLPLRSLYYMLQSSGYLEPDMTYEAFVYLLDLESTQLSPTEVNEAYLKYKRTGKKIEIEPKDWYSPQSLYEDSKSSETEKASESEEEQ